MKKLLFLSVLLGSFYMTQEAVAVSFCYNVCNRVVCKVKEAQDFCIQKCSEKETVNCRKQNAEPVKVVAEKTRKEACYRGFNRATCKNVAVAKLAEQICQPNEIKNCLNAAGMSSK